MPSASLNQELSKLESSTIIELYELDASPVGLSTPLYFHVGTNQNYQNITFAGQEYIAFPVEFSGFEYDGKGSLPRPKLRISNINGVFSTYLRQYNNFIGSKITRKRTFLRLIDGANFPGGNNPYGSPSTELLTNDEFYVHQKIVENNQVIEFELSTRMELNNVQIPGRKIIANTCTCKRYRDGLVCPYSGPPVTDKNNTSFSEPLPFGYGMTVVAASPLEWSAQSYTRGKYVTKTSVNFRETGIKYYYIADATTTADDIPGVSPKWIADACPRTQAGCKKRFPAGPLPFGGFPAAARFPFG